MIQPRAVRRHPDEAIRGQCEARPSPGRSGRAVRYLGRHWLAMANGAFLLALALSAAVPAMRAAGLSWLADPLFASFRIVCHQSPERSFFLFDHQMAMCQRDVAIYASMAMAGLLFARFRGRIPPLRWRWYLAATIPLAVDGLTQLLGIRESSWELRMLTGSLFGGATVWLAYPHIDPFALTIRGRQR